MGVRDPPTGTGWTTTAAVGRHSCRVGLGLRPAIGPLLRPSQPAPKAHVQFTNTFTEPASATTTLMVASVSNAPTGSHAGAARKWSFTGSCPSSLRPRRLGNGESATPTLTGGTAGQSCNVLESASHRQQVDRRATVNGTAVALVSSAGRLSGLSFAPSLTGNTVQFTRTPSRPLPTGDPEGRLRDKRPSRLPPGQHAGGLQLLPVGLHDRGARQR